MEDKDTKGRIDQQSRKPVPLTCIVDGDTVMVIGKEWYDREQRWPDGPCQDPCNYFDEVEAIMLENGFSCIEEGAYAKAGLSQDGIEQLAASFLAHGYELVQQDGSTTCD